MHKKAVKNYMFILSQKIDRFDTKDTDTMLIKQYQMKVLFPLSGYLEQWS
jgi:hypothetical protein